MPVITRYNRIAAVNYAHKWAFARNPNYYNYDLIGGDCTNFASQVIYAGSGVMNYTPIYGWYYRSANDKSPSWTGVEFLYDFLTKNQGVGPFAKEANVEEIAPGDLIQLSFNGIRYQHSPIVVKVGNPPAIDNILIAAHTFNADNRPINSYIYSKIRFVHILGVRKPI